MHAHLARRALWCQQRTSIPPTHTQAKHSFAARALRSPSRDAAPTQTWRLFESFPCHSQRRPPPAATFCGSAPRAADPRCRPLGLSHRALAPPCLPCQGPQLWLLPCWGPACGVWQLSGSWHSHRGEHSPLRTTHILSIPWLAAAQLWAPRDATAPCHCGAWAQRPQAAAAACLCVQAVPVGRGGQLAVAAGGCVLLAELQLRQPTLANLIGEVTLTSS